MLHLDCSSGSYDMTRFLDGSLFAHNGIKELLVFVPKEHNPRTETLLLSLEEILADTIGWMCSQKKAKKEKG